MTDDFSINIQSTVDWLKVCLALMDRYHITYNEILDLIKSDVSKYIKVETVKTE